MDKIKRLITLHVPISTCNLRCPYCYITIQKRWNQAAPLFEHSPVEIARAFSQERLGGSCFINMCASGETLLAPNIVSTIKCLLEQGHYIEVVTNGTVSKRFTEISQYPSELLERLTFKFSFHYTELKRTKSMHKFFDNIHMMRDCGCSFTVEMTPTDELEPYVDEIKTICQKELGALCHTTIARDDSTKNIDVLSQRSLKEYVNFWSNHFHSEMLNFKYGIFQRKIKEFCYAGQWSAYINLL